MSIQTPKNRRLLIAIIMMASLLASASYSVAMPLIMASAECAMETTPCDMCCLMSQPDPLTQNKVSLVLLLESYAIGIPDSTPLPFYHPPG
jgi:hypothetical protein